MEYYQTTQNRAAQTVAVITHSAPGLTVGDTSVADLQAQALALEGLSQMRDDALVAYDRAVNAENQGFLAIQAMVLTLPLAAEADLDDSNPIESGLLDLLGPVYGITPRTTELALERGKKLVSALTTINAYQISHIPPRRPILSGGRDVEALMTALAIQPGLEQEVDDRVAQVMGTRIALRLAATGVDRLNKRFYAKLQSEARSSPTLAQALGQIATESANLPHTLSIRSLLQGGTDNLHLLLSYDNGSYDGTATSSVEWQVVGTDADFVHQVGADPSGNTLGPFAKGQMVRVRTRVVSGNGATTGSVRVLTLV